MDPATVTIQLKPDDMQNFFQFVADRTKKRNWVLFVVVVVVFVAIYAVKGAVTHPLPASAVPVHHGPLLSPAHSLMVLGFGLGMIIVLRLLRRWLVGNPRLVKKTSPDAFDPRTYTVLDTGLRCQQKLGESMNHWPAIVRFAETPDYFFIMIAERRGHVLPKRCFATSEDAAIFANQVRQHLTMQAPKALAGAAR
jgi:hypothetical protein